MKHLTLLLPLLFLTALPCSAQEFHLSVGYNGSNVSKATNEQWKGRGGYQFGADVLIGHRWFIKPGIHYVSRNLKFSYVNSADNSTLERNYTSRSLSIPVMFGSYFLDPVENSEFNIYAMGGPTAFIGLKADMDGDELTVDTRPAQWYLGFGAGVEFGFLFLESGYDVAMTNVFKGEHLDTNPKVNYLHIIGGLRLNLVD